MAILAFAMHFSGSMLGCIDELHLLFLEGTYLELQSSFLKSNTNIIFRVD